MNADYRRRQQPGNWPRPFDPDELPPWYCELLGNLVGSMTRWRDDHDDPHRLDPRCDPRGPTSRSRTRGNHASG